MYKLAIPCLLLCFVVHFTAPPAISGQEKPRIAVFSGPNATILNSPPLVTSNKARALRSLPWIDNQEQTPARFDPLVPQRLAAPVEVFIEQFSAHPLEKDAARLYGPPDGYVDGKGRFHPSRQSAEDKPVYRVTLRPEDGLYPLPYMAVQADGRPWDDDCAFAGAPPEKCRQPFYPDASRLFEEIDRTIVGRAANGAANLLSGRAHFDFYRAAPSGGYTQGQPAAERTDQGAGDVARESLGNDYFPYRPYQHLREPGLEDLAKVTNLVQQVLRRGNYAGAIWLEGSPTVADTLYWLDLLIDTDKPICGNAAQRLHSAVGDDGGRNIIDSVDYLTSLIWRGDEGHDELGAVLIQDEQIFAARQVEKQDARPGGYRAAGGHGGVLGTIGDPGAATLWFKPLTRHTWNSAVNLTQLPASVDGVSQVDGKTRRVTVAIKDQTGWLLPGAIPKVTIARYNPWIKEGRTAAPAEEVEILARIARDLAARPLAGIVVEGTTPFGSVQDSMMRALELAAFSGLPVVRVSRGDEGGMVPVNPYDLTIEGSNLTAGKARMLLMAALMKFGSLPPAADPQRPTLDERRAIQEKIKQYQEIFNSH